MLERIGPAMEPGEGQMGNVGLVTDYEELDMPLTCSLRLSTTAIAGFAINAAVLAQEPVSEQQPVVVDPPITAPLPYSDIDGSDILATDEFDVF